MPVLELISNRELRYVQERHQQQGDKAVARRAEQKVAGQERAADGDDRGVGGKKAQADARAHLRPYERFRAVRADRHAGKLRDGGGRLERAARQPADEPVPVPQPLQVVAEHHVQLAAELVEEAHQKPALAARDRPERVVPDVHRARHHRPLRGKVVGRGRRFALLVHRHRVEALLEYLHRELEPVLLVGQVCRRPLALLPPDHFQRHPAGPRVARVLRLGAQKDGDARHHQPGRVLAQPLDLRVRADLGAVREPVQLLHQYAHVPHQIDVGQDGRLVHLRAEPHVRQQVDERFRTPVERFRYCVHPVRFRLRLLREQPLR
uniref:Uncharacterized protein n=1 Tax=Anopheles coluzzii TaxID=1518534 RepID=A0A8W7PPB0_ANOCL